MQNENTISYTNQIKKKPQTPQIQSNTFSQNHVHTLWFRNQSESVSMVTSSQIHTQWPEEQAHVKGLEMPACKHSTKATMISMGSTLINLGDSLPYNLSMPSYGRIYVH